MSSPSGRQTTLRYIPPGGLFGVATLFTDSAAHVGSTALSDSRVLVFRSRLLREAAHADIRVALAFLRETSERVNGYIHELGGSVFSSVRPRVVRHLIDSAVVDPDTDSAVATVSQQELADAAGSLRETVYGSSASCARRASSRPAGTASPCSTRSGSSGSSEFLAASTTCRWLERTFQARGTIGADEGDPPA